MKLTHPIFVVCALVLAVAAAAWYALRPTADLGLPTPVEKAPAPLIVIDQQAAEREAIAYGMTQLKKIEQRWSDADALGKATARIQLAPVVRDMQAISRETTALQGTLPKCLRDAVSSLTASQTATIERYLAFMRSDLDMLLAVDKHDPEQPMRDYVMARDSCAAR